MEDYEGEILTRLARIEERQRQHWQELLRSRRRLHTLEGATQGLVTLQREKIKDDRRREKKADRRIRTLTFGVAVAGVIIPTANAIYGWFT